MTFAQRLAVTTALATLVLVGVGVLVRATGSGLGCPDWPTCHGGAVPPAHKHAMIEFNAIALLRRRAATSCQLPLAEGQRFLEMHESDKARLVQAYRANGMSGKPERLQRRYDHGMRCFAIEEGERIVAWFWALHGVPRYMDEFAWQIPLNETQVWLRDAFVVPEGVGITHVLARFPFVNFTRDDHIRTAV